VVNSTSPPARARSHTHQKSEIAENLKSKFLIGARYPRDAARMGPRLRADAPPMEPKKMTKNPKKQHKTPPESMGIGAVDGKGPAKRFKQIVSALNRESRHEHIGHAEAAMIDVAAIALLRLEQIKARVLNGDDVNDEDLVRLSNAAVRAVAALGATKRKGKPPSDALADHIARIKSKAKP
jgi:hypothetical protein